MQKVMVGHDIVVIGASAGGVTALRQLCRNLPADLPAAILVVQHISPTANSVLPSLLSRAGPLPAVHAREGMAIERGHIYVAPPDHHLLVADDHLMVRRGPLENRTRPAADPLFRSAAVAHGPRVVAMVLTGTLDDGSAGLLAVKRCGGITVVQDPADATWPDMPRNAMLHDHIDHVLPLAGIPALLARLAREKPGPPVPVPDDIRREVAIAAQEYRPMVHSNPEATSVSVTGMGSPSRLSCPDCGGVLDELMEEGQPRFRCQIGHAFGVDSLAAAQWEGLEHALALAVRAHHERGQLFARMLHVARERGHTHTADRWEMLAREAGEAAASINRLIAAVEPQKKAV